MKKVILSMAILFLSVVSAFGYFGEVKKKFVASGVNWGGGGVTIRDGFIWENARYKQTIYQRNPVSGQYMGKVTYQPELRKTVGVSWDSKRNVWWLSNPFNGTLEMLPANGGASTSRFISRLWIAGNFYDANTDTLWVAGNVHGAFAEYKLPNGDAIRSAKLPYTIQGIARVGDFLWVGGPNNRVTQLTLRGQKTGKYFDIPENQVAQSIAYDGQYLWLRGQLADGEKGQNNLYQIDIEGEPVPNKTPITTKTPVINKTPVAVKTPVPVITATPTCMPSPLPEPEPEKDWLTRIINFLKKLFGKD